MGLDERKRTLWVGLGLDRSAMTLVETDKTQPNPDERTETHPVPGLRQQLHVLLQIQRGVFPLVVRPVAEP